MFNECRHILPSGRKCKAAALRDKCFCYFHWQLRSTHPKKGRPKKSFPRPSLEDPQGIQIALTQILDNLGSSTLDNKGAGLYLYGLQIATQLANRASLPEPSDVVRSLSSDPAGGDDLAPETIQCEPGTECDSCAIADQCVLPARIAYLGAKRENANALKEIQRQIEIDEGRGFSQALAWASEPEWQDPDAEEEAADPDLGLDSETGKATNRKPSYFGGS